MPSDADQSEREDSISDDEDECWKELLGGADITFDQVWQEEKVPLGGTRRTPNSATSPPPLLAGLVDPNQLNKGEKPGILSQQQNERWVSHAQCWNQVDTSRAFGDAGKPVEGLVSIGILSSSSDELDVITKEGHEPPAASCQVQEKHLRTESSGKSNSLPHRGLLATRSFSKGDVVFTERAAVVASPTRLSNKGVRCCPKCCQSLEPMDKIMRHGIKELPHPESWPVPPLEWVQDEGTSTSTKEEKCSATIMNDNTSSSLMHDGNKETTDMPHSYYRQDRHRRVQCQRNTPCEALFCSIYCYRSYQEQYGSCCHDQPIHRALLKFYATHRVDEEKVDDDCNPVASGGSNIMIQAPVVLAVHLFRQVVQYHRTKQRQQEQRHHEASLSASSNHKMSGPTTSTTIPFWEMLCGDASELTALELGVEIKDQDLRASDNANNTSIRMKYTLQPLYERLVDILELSTTERGALSVNTLEGFAAKTARNGIGFRTKSPFSTYYAGLKRLNRHNSNRHDDHARQIANVVFGEDRLDRGMDRQIDEWVAPQVCAIATLTAMCNHSCTPNAQIQGQGFVDAHIDLMAIQDIAKGDEIQISYIGLPPASATPLERASSSVATQKRRRELQAKYLFSCQCALCAGLR